MPITIILSKRGHMMWIVLFIYLLVGIRIAINIVHTASGIQRIGEYKHIVRPFLKQGLLAVLFWPFDFLLMPMDFVKGYLFLDRLSLFRIHFYYGRRSR